MSHPNPQHDRENQYPSDGYRSGTGGLSKGTRRTLGISEMLTTDHKASMKAGKANAKSAALKSKTGFDGNKRWGNSAVKGYGVNSPAMMEARKKFDK